ncbi:hypothetical protein B7H23_03335 [Notoacmeibacter marinus]|uniref:Uncharacterized protein n=2 Tax=Notoacmeibacter marinus TaxID=1876515 RepID=A0A231V1B6_9HYPH|nr:hypothetical protein B7H23_03335 [Notoacmeibacter marinus]
MLSIRTIFVDQMDINAYCIPLDRHRYLLVCDMGLFVAAQEMAFACFSYPTLYKVLLGQPRIKSITPWMDFAEPIGMNWLSFNSLPLYNLQRNRFVQENPEVKQPASILTEMMLVAVLLHELGHAFDGHYGLTNTDQNISEAGENFGKLARGSAFKVISEMRADEVSMRFLISTAFLFFNRWYGSTLQTPRRLYLWLILATTLNGIIWAWLDKKHTASPESLASWVSHPSGRIRANGAVWSVLQGMDHACADNHSLIAGALDQLQLVRHLYELHPTTFNLLSTFHHPEEDTHIAAYRESIILPNLNRFEEITRDYQFQAANGAWRD